MYDAPRHVPRINRNLDVRLPIDFAENLDGFPEFGSWNRLPAGHLTSQIASLLQGVRGDASHEDISLEKLKAQIQQRFEYK